MAAMKISVEPRYQRTGSARQQEARHFSAMVEKIFASALVATHRRALKQQGTKPSHQEKA